MPLTPPLCHPGNLRLRQILAALQTKIFGSQQSCYIDSISLCNTSDSDLFFDIKIIGERIEDDVPVVKEAYHPETAS